VPAVSLLDDAFVEPSLASLLWAVVFAVVIASSPLLRRWRPGLVICSGVVATVVAFWFTGTYVVPRFLSFLLVPLFVLVATGSAAILARPISRLAAARTVVVVALFAMIAVLSAPFLVDVPRLPRDSTSEAALTINTVVPSSTSVFAHVAYPYDLQFHLERPVIGTWTAEEASGVCRAGRLAVYVDQPFLVPDADPQCTRRDGARHYRFEQYARGHEINVWVIPPAES
jgi:hypothetical protein